MLFTLISIESSQILSMWMTCNHLKTNSTKFAHYLLKTRKVIEFFYFQSLMQHSLSHRFSHDWSILLLKIFQRWINQENLSSVVKLIMKTKNAFKHNSFLNRYTGVIIDREERYAHADDILKTLF